MSKKIATNLNFNKNQAENLVLHSLSTDPSNPVEGQIYWNSGSKKTPYVYDGTHWLPMVQPSSNRLNTQTGSSYTLALTDAGKIVAMSNASNPITLTIPTNASVPFAIGEQIDFLQMDSKQISFSVASGVTLYSKDENVKTAKKGSGATLVKVDTNTWYLIGDLVEEFSL